LLKITATDLTSMTGMTTGTGIMTATMITITGTTGIMDEAICAITIMIARFTIGTARITSTCRPDCQSATGCLPAWSANLWCAVFCQLVCEGECSPAHELEAMLPPPEPGYAHVFIGGNLVLVNRANFQVADVFHFDVNF
jgi:hypothetical protein